MTNVPKVNLPLLPGLLNDARLFQYQEEDLADIAQTLVADMTVADTIPELAAEVLAHAPQQFALAGLSLGGDVALEIMRQAPGRVLGLALLDTNARTDTPEATANGHTQMAQAESNFQIVLDNLMPTLVHPSRMKYHSIVDTLYSMGYRVGKDAFLRQKRASMGRIDSRPYLGSIDCPTLVLCGREDVIAPLEMHEEMAAAIPGAHLAVIDECAHLSAMGQPRLVAEAMRDWLRRIKSQQKNGGRSFNAATRFERRFSRPDPVTRADTC
ncbi:MAG: alpha/beta hydrolase [Betaproteobacteria bacterium]